LEQVDSTVELKVDKTVKLELDTSVELNPKVLGMLVLKYSALYKLGVDVRLPLWSIVPTISILSRSLARSRFSSNKVVR
jgi:hypothetical protein